MRKILLATLLTAASVLPFAGSANAQVHSDAVMRQCAQTVGQMKFEGWPADRNREMMMMACLGNNGSIPGAVNEKPVALPKRTPAPNQH